MEIDSFPNLEGVIMLLVGAFCVWEFVSIIQVRNSLVARRLTRALKDYLHFRIRQFQYPVRNTIQYRNPNEVVVINPGTESIMTDMFVVPSGLFENFNACVKPHLANSRISLCSSKHGCNTQIPMRWLQITWAVNP